MSEELSKEVQRLTQALNKANSEFEKYERLWYLERDKTEDLRQQIAVLEWKVRKLHALTNTTDYDLGNYEDERIG